MKRFLFMFLLTSRVFILFAQEEELRLMTYNVENLFDTFHDSLKSDQEFLPEAPRHWTYTRYKQKLNHLGQCIIATGGWQPPALVALCEVENETVMKQLTRYSALRNAGYRYVMTDSPDSRGIDVALLYQREHFCLLQSNSYRIRFPDSQSYRPTRDILHVTGRILSGDTLDICVVHFPSRSGGAKESEPARILAARQLRQLTDSILHRRTFPMLIIMGDFNDYPLNSSFKKVLETLLPPSETTDSLYNTRLYSLTEPLLKEKIGTYKYQGEWGILDHILVNGTLLSDRSPLYIPSCRAEIVTHPFLLQPDPQNLGTRPFRTYHGYRYHGGYSDHLPVTVKCILQTSQKEKRRSPFKETSPSQYTVPLSQKQ